MTTPSKTRSVLQRLTVLSVLCATAVLPAAGAPTASDVNRWTERFDLSTCKWASTGRNDLFILEPGYQQIFEGHEGKDPVRLEITVLNETKIVGGVETRVIEERETRKGELIEVSRNFFAICNPTSEVFYFGENVDMYEGGKVVNHEGSWMAETGGAKPGLFMPARPLLGARFYQEIAPRVAMDRVEIASDAESLKTPAGEFRNCVKTKETTPLEPGVTEYKLYARGVGLVQDGELLLTRYGTLPPKKR
jgi:hypothetical protein